MAGLVIHEKDDQAEWVVIVAHLEQTGRRKNQRSAIDSFGAEFLHFPHNSYVVQCSACIFPFPYLRHGGVFRQSCEERCMGIGGSMHRKVHLAIDPVRIRDGNLFLRSSGGASHRSTEFVCVASNELFGAIDNHLWGVNFVERKLMRILILPIRHGVEREWIAPTLVIPICDVFAEDDGLRAGNELRCLKACEQSVGRWTIGAAFRRKQFDKNRLILDGNRGRNWLDGCSECETRRFSGERQR